MSEAELWAEIRKLQGQINTLQHYKEKPFETIRAEYSTAAEQSFTHNVAAICDYETKTMDTHDCVTTGAAWKFTCKSTGIYSVKHYNVLAGNNGWEPGEIYSSDLYKNGVNQKQISMWICNDNTAPTALASVAHGSCDIYLVTGDYIDIRLYQNSDNNIKLYASALWNWISVARTA